MTITIEFTPAENCESHFDSYLELELVTENRATVAYAATREAWEFQLQGYKARGMTSIASKIANAIAKSGGK